MLEHLPGLCGLTAPSFNSYQRIAPGTWSGAYGCWGYDNREAPVRVASPFRGAEEASTNVELKAADATCNPYLALGGLIAAGLDGIERGLTPPEPVDVDPATLERPRGARDRAAAREPGRGARRAGRRRGADERARRRARGLLSRRPPLGVDGLLRGGRGIRPAGSLREVLNAVALVDHHAHGILREPPGTLDEFRGLFSESEDPRQWPHVATAITYRRAIRELARHFGVEPTEDAVFAHRRSRDPLDYAASLLRATNTEVLLVDDGFPPPAISVNWDELGTVAGCRAAPVMRIETLRRGPRHGGRARAQRASSRSRRSPPTAAGCERHQRRACSSRWRSTPRPAIRSRCRSTPASATPTSRCRSSRPGLLKPLIERYDTTPFVLLHCYPFVREAGWLAHVYANVFFDLSLTIPHVAQPEQALREALELAPLSKLLYASDAARTPELYFLGATWWRDALAVVLPELGEGEAAARMILRENALALYRLSA